MHGESWASNGQYAMQTTKLAPYLYLVWSLCSRYITFTNIPSCSSRNLPLLGGVHEYCGGLSISTKVIPPPSSSFAMCQFFIGRDCLKFHVGTTFCSMKDEIKCPLQESHHNWPQLINGQPQKRATPNVPMKSYQCMNQG